MFKRRDMMPNLLHRKWAFLLPLVLLLCACAVSPKNTPFAELSSRVEAVLHTPADERKAYFALHYGDLLRAGQIAFPEEYSTLSGAEKAEEWAASLDTASDYEATLLAINKGDAKRLKEMEAGVCE